MNRFNHFHTVAGRRNPCLMAALAGIAAGITLTAGLSVAQADTVLFQDLFNNGNPENVNGESPNYWNYQDASPGGYGTYSISESGGSISPPTPGTLAMTATNTSSTQAAMGLNSAQLQKYNFFVGPVTFSASGLSITGSPNNNNSNLYFSVLSKATSTAYNSSTSDRIGIRLRGDGNFGFGIGDGSGPLQSSAAYFGLVNLGTTTITGLAMTLNASSWAANSATGTLTYNLSFTYSGTDSLDSNHDGVISSTDAGFSELSGSLSNSVSTTFLDQWLTDNGAGRTTADALAAIAMQSRVTTSAYPASSTVSMNTVAVSTVPEPATLGLLALGGLALLRPRRKRA